MRRGNTWARWIWLAIVVYMMYTVGRLAYRNYQLNVQEATLKADVAALQVDIAHLQNQIVYFQSESYKEKMQREKLNLQKPGEKVVVITPEPKLETPNTETKNHKVSNPQAWWDYFVGI
jgi:cell division protein FtsB